MWTCFANHFYFANGQMVYLINLSTIFKILWYHFYWENDLVNFTLVLTMSNWNLNKFFTFYSKIDSISNSMSMTETIMLKWALIEKCRSMKICIYYMYFKGISQVFQFIFYCLSERQSRFYYDSTGNMWQCSFVTLWIWESVLLR